MRARGSFRVLLGEKSGPPSVEKSMHQVGSPTSHDKLTQHCGWQPTVALSQSVADMFES